MEENDKFNTRMWRKPWFAVTESTIPIQWIVYIFHKMVFPAFLECFIPKPRDFQQRERMLDER